MRAKWMLIRGLSRGNGHWGDFPDYLKKNNIDVELMEIPGNGTSHHMPTSTDVNKIISDIKLKSCFSQSNEKMNLLGISLGGMIALKWAELYPNDLNSIAVVNTSLKQYSVFYQRLLPGNYLKILSALTSKSPEFQQKTILNLTSNRKDRVASYFKEFLNFSIQNPVSLANFRRQLILASKIHLDNRITIPVKVIGSELDRLVSVKCSLEIAKQLNVTAFIHPTAGHDLPLDEPEWLAKMIL